MTDEPRPDGAHEDPEHPGWLSWGEFPRGSFAAATCGTFFTPADTACDADVANAPA